MKQEGMLDHYQETYRVTHRFEYERNRLFVLFILVLIVAIYLALNKEVAQVALDFFAPKSDAARDALAKVNFYRIFNVISIMAAFYLVVNLHHRYSTIKRNYTYLAKLEHEIRDELQIEPPKIAFTRESRTARRSRNSFASATASSSSRSCSCSWGSGCGRTGRDGLAAAQPASCCRPNTPSMRCCLVSTSG